MRKNLGVIWSPVTFQTVTGTKAGTYFIHSAKRQSQTLLASKNTNQNLKVKYYAAKGNLMILNKIHPRKQN